MRLRSDVEQWARRSLLRELPFLVTSSAVIDFDEVSFTRNFNLPLIPISTLTHRLTEGREGRDLGLQCLYISLSSTWTGHWTGMTAYVRMSSVPYVRPNSIVVSQIFPANTQYDCTGLHSRYDRTCLSLVSRGTVPYSAYRTVLHPVNSSKPV